MTMTQFELARQKRLELEKEEQAKNEKKKSSLYVKDYEDIAWMGITREPRVFRILGNPAEARLTNFDSKIVYWGKILHDNGKSFVNIYFPQNDKFEINKDWILYRLYEKINESKWIDYKEGDVIDPLRPRSTPKGYFANLHEHTLSHKRVTDNKKEGSNQFGHFYPKRRILMNVIDRMDDWCKENKHTKILTSNHSPFEITDEVTKTKKTIYFNDVGMPNEFYKLLYSQVLEFRASWDLDIILHKEDKKYILRDGLEDKVPMNVKPLVNINPLTDEEKTYVQYDIDKLFKDTGYYKLFNSFEKLFKQADLDLGTRFFEELKELYEDEKIQRDKERSENDKSVHPVSQEVSQSPRQVEPEAKTEVRRGTPNPEQVIESVGSKLEKTPGWGSLSDNDKQEMTKYCTSIDGNKFSYKDGTSLIPCSCDKKINFPDSVWHCTMCSVEFS